jgi:hypothetical protein
MKKVFIFIFFIFFHFLGAQSPFTPASPASLELGSSLTVTLSAFPKAEILSVEAVDVSQTGGIFTLISLNSFTFENASSTGIASAFIVAFTANGELLFLNYDIGVLSLQFSTSSPLLLPAGANSFALTATGSPSGGSYSNSPTLDSGTGGSFSSIHSSNGSFSYSGSSSAGRAQTGITYTDSSGQFSLTKTFVVRTNLLNLSSPSPASVLAQAGGSSPLTVSVLGALAGGSFSLPTQNSEGTSGTFSTSSNDQFTFSGATSSGNPFVNAVYTLSNPTRSVNFTFNVIVLSVTFTPASPLTVALNSTTFISIATAPLAGTLGILSSNTQQTRGAFSLSGTQLSFVQPRRAGTASVVIQFQADSPSNAIFTFSYTIQVATLSFSPTSPLAYIPSSPQSIQATGNPVGGTFSRIVNDVDSTGLFVSSISGSGLFSISGGSSGGVVEIEVHYTLPSSSTDLIATFLVEVVTLQFTPASPASIFVGDLLNVTAVGLPTGGTFTGGGNFNSNTGGTFSSISSSGSFTFSGSTQGGTATASFTYSPPAGFPVLTLIYTVHVSSLTFSPASPIAVEALSTGSLPVSIQALGLGAGGTYAIGLGGVSTGGTGGSFSGPTATGNFSFSGATSGGIASISIAYTPPNGLTVSATFILEVLRLNLSTASDTTLVSLGSLSDLTVTLTSSSTISFGAINTGGTGGSFLPSGGGSSSESFTFTTSTTTALGTATLQILLTSPSGGVLSHTYRVIVGSLSFNPASPLSFLAGSPDATIATTGLPTGGSLSLGTTSVSATGGSFSLTGTNPAVLTFGGSGSPITASGTATAQVIYTLPSGTISAVFEVNVGSGLTFSPANPLKVSLAPGSPPSGMVSITAVGSPGSGTFSSSAATGGTTGGTFVAINASGIFSFSGATSAGVASMTITYNPGSAPVSVVYEVYVSRLSFSPASPQTLTLGQNLTFSVSGAPTPGTVSFSGFGSNTTGGTLTQLAPTAFRFSGASMTGTANLNFTYNPNPANFPNVTALYSIIVIPAGGPTTIVTNTNDSGAGSLRQVVLDLTSGGTVTFAAGLSGSTITLTTGEILLNKNMTIQGLGASVLSVSGNNSSRIFQITGSVTVAINDLTLTQGSASGSAGGAILVASTDTLTLTDCVITGNSALNGAGIYNVAGVVNVNSSTLSGNTATLDGGGIYNNGISNLTNCTVSANIATSGGGGFFNNSATLSITNCTISGNSALSFEGGGIFNNNISTLTVTNSTLSGNTATLNGGGIYNENGVATLTSCTLSGNTAIRGGGIEYLNGTINIGMTIIAGNTATSNSDVSGSFTSSDYNLIGDDTGSTGFTRMNDQVGTSAEPLDPLLAPLAFYGGTTETHALLFGSPAIDAGDPSFAPPPTTDQRGFARIQNGVVDIGAVEFVLPSHTITMISPSFGSLAGGTAVTILGTGFTSVDTVNFASQASDNVIPVSSSLISGDSPPSTVGGGVFISVTLSDGSVAFSPERFFYATPETSLIITGIIDGDLSGGTPKAIELYVTADIADLSLYGISSPNNGAASPGPSSPEFTFPVMSVVAGSYIYVASEGAQFDEFFGLPRPLLFSTNGVANNNGDDALELVLIGSSIIDNFGEFATDGTGRPWEYSDGWAYRNSNTGPDASTESLGSWTFSGINALDGEATNALATTPFPIGTYVK